MTKILEVNEDGALMIPADLLNGAEPHQRYTAESAGKNLLLRPESESAPVENVDPEEWRGLTIEEKIQRIAAQVPEDEWDKLPLDLSENLDHYVYGLPKK